MQTKFILPLLILLGLGFNISAGNDNPLLGVKNLELPLGDYSFYSIDILYNHDNNSLVIGGFTGYIVINGDTLNSSKIRSGFIGAIDNAGQWSWAKKIEGSGYNQINTALVLDEGWIIAGVFADTIKPDGNDMIAEDYQNIFLAKINLQGEFLWTKSLKLAPVGGKQFLTGDKNNSFILGAEFTGEFTFSDSTYSTQNQQAALIAKLSNDGEIDDVKIIRSRSSLQLNFLEPYTGRRTLLGITYSDTLYIDNQELINTGRNDFFIAALDKSFHVKWLEKSSGYGNKNLAGAVRHQGGVILYGDYKGEFLWDDEEFSAENGNHIFMIKLTGNVNTQWKQSIAGLSYKKAFGTAIDEYHKIFLLGSYRGKMEFLGEELQTESFTHEMFLAKFSKHGHPLWLEKAKNPNNIQIRLNPKAKEGQFELFGFNANTQQKLFGKEFENENNSMFMMELIDCEYHANKKHLPADTVFCGSGILDGGEEFASYKWNETAHGQFFEVDQTGMVYLELTDQYGCISMDSISVEVQPGFAISITGDDEICPDQGSTLLMVDADAQITWSTGETGHVIFVDQQGAYQAEAINNKGCKADDEIMVNYYQTSNPQLEDYYMISRDETLELYPGEYDYYNWTGNITDEIFIIDGSEYEVGGYNFTLEAEDHNGCVLFHDFLVDILTAYAHSGTQNNEGSEEDDEKDMSFDLKQAEGLTDCDFRFYPNPGSGPFYIMLDPGYSAEHSDNHETKYEIVILGMHGEIIVRETLQKNISPWKIDKSHRLNPGNYAVALLIDENLCNIKKIIVLN